MLLNIKFVLSRLPFVEVRNRRELPQCPGVYYVFRGNRILYIGRAKVDLRYRWKRHHELPNLDPDDRIHYRQMPSWAVSDRESLDIAKHNPPLNGRKEPRDKKGILYMSLANAFCILAAFALYRLLCLVLGW